MLQRKMRSKNLKSYVTSEKENTLLLYQEFLNCLHVWLFAAVVDSMAPSLHLISSIWSVSAAAAFSIIPFLR